MKTISSYFPLFCPGLLLVFSLSVISCKKTTSSAIEANSPMTPDTGVYAAAPVLQQSISTNSSWAVNWNNRADGTYAVGAAAADLGNVSGWVNTRAWISAGTLRITLLPNRLSDSCGILSNINVVTGSEYQVDYDVRFHSQFDWGRGGKLGFGFLVGDGNTGGVPGWDGNGGSMRLIWYQTTQGRVYFQPYLYYKDQPNQTGDDFGVTYPVTGSISKAKWYHVTMYIKSNTGSNYNGHARIAINGTTILDTGIRWTSNDSERLVQSICFQTFRGGDTPDYESSTMGYIYYDNLKVQKIN